MTRISDNFKQESQNIRDQIMNLEANGFTLECVSDGEELHRVTTVDEAMDHIDGVDESWVYFNPSACIFLVRGNRPWEVICDYAGDIDEFILDFES